MEAPCWFCCSAYGVRFEKSQDEKWTSWWPQPDALIASRASRGQMNRHRACTRFSKIKSLQHKHFYVTFDPSSLTFLRLNCSPSVFWFILLSDGSRFRSGTFPMKESVYISLMREALCLRRILKGEGAVIKVAATRLITSSPMLPCKKFWHMQKKPDFMIHI